MDLNIEGTSKEKKINTWKSIKVEYLILRLKGLLKTSGPFVHFKDMNSQKCTDFCAQQVGTIRVRIGRFRKRIQIHNHANTSVADP
jgi:hypothetical protein